MVVKSLSPNQHTYDLTMIFAELRKHNMRLNPKKCTFGVKGSKFLGFMLTYKGIEANPDKCEVVIARGSPENMNELQKLIRKLVYLSLSQFLPKMAKKEKPFFKLLIMARNPQRKSMNNPFDSSTSSTWCLQLNIPEQMGKQKQKQGHPNRDEEKSRQSNRSLG